MKEITVQVNTTTGGCFDVTINEEGHVDELRWQIARKLQTPRDRLTLIHRERYGMLLYLAYPTWPGTFFIKMIRMFIFIQKKLEPIDAELGETGINR